MIIVSSVKKVYNPNKKNECHALKDVSFTLNSTGMVFVLGKSGSGKSTLLNLLGGLDSITSGSIFINDQDLALFSTKELENYRNNAVGFVFQDYNLIEGMTVFENIALALSLQGQTNDDLVLNTLKSVDLFDKKDALVSNLSGGQKQRVAIARAIIKSPPLVLADEPTGNLDVATSRQIFKILKDLSKDRLVIIVSHNRADAFEYGDRIIEISDGQIIEDVDNVPIETENVAVLSSLTSLDDEKIKSANEKIKEFGIKIAKEKNKRLKHVDTADEKPFSCNISQQNKMLFKTKFSLFKHFFKKKGLGSFIMIIVLASLITLTGLCQTFYNVNSSAILQSAIQIENPPLVFQKGVYDDFTNTINTNYLGAVTDDDVNTFIQNGYNGEAFKLYKYATPITPNHDPTCFGSPSPFRISNGLFLTTNGNGVLVCSKDYLTNLYGVDGELNVLSGDLEAHDYGIIVTDYFADSFLKANRLTYL